MTKKQKEIIKRSTRISNDLSALVEISMTHPEAINIVEIEDYLHELIRSVQAIYVQEKTDKLQ